MRWVLKSIFAFLLAELAVGAASLWDLQSSLSTSAHLRAYLLVGALTLTVLAATAFGGWALGSVLRKWFLDSRAIFVWWAILGVYIGSVFFRSLLPLRTAPWYVICASAVMSLAIPCFIVSRLLAASGGKTLVEAIPVSFVCVGLGYLTSKTTFGWCTAWVLIGVAVLWLVLSLHRLAWFRWPPAIFVVAAVLGVVWVRYHPVSFSRPWKYAPAAASSRDNLILMTMDAARAANMSLYGYGVRTTPRLEEFSKQATVYEHAYSTATWDLPAHASLFTGLYPSEHGAHRPVEGSSRRPIYFGYPLSESFTTLAERLPPLGYATAAFAGLHYGPMDPSYGLAQGFSVYWQESRSTLLTRPHLAGIIFRRTPVWDRVVRKIFRPEERHIYPTAGEITDMGLDWLSTARFWGAPFFLFLNYGDQQLPHAVMPSVKAELDSGGARHTGANLPFHYSEKSLDLMSSYDEQMYYMDREIGRFLMEIRQKEFYGRTWIVVLGVCGESFGETEGVDYHGRNNLWTRETWIPLVVRRPGQETPARDTTPIDLVDLHGYLLSNLGAADPNPVHASRLVDPAAASYRPLIAEAHPFLHPIHYFWKEDGPRSHLMSVTVWPWSYIRSETGRIRELYRLDHDPLETKNVLSEEPDAAARMESVWTAWRGKLRVSE